MTINYFKIAWRGLINNPFFSTINIAGLAVGISTVLLIGMWMFDELSFNKYHQNYDRIAQVMRHSVVNGGINSQTSMSIPLRQELGNVGMQRIGFSRTIQHWEQGGGQNEARQVLAKGDVDVFVMSPIDLPTRESTISSS
jgi:hypothetical protein